MKNLLQTAVEIRKTNR